MKSEHKDGPLYLPVQVMLNSMFGKTGERIPKGKGRLRVMGNFFNPAIFAHIPGATRAQLYQYIVKNRLERDVVFTATDSICATRNLGIDSCRLGELSLKGHAFDIFCIQTGITRFDGQWKERGIGSLQGKTIENYSIEEKNGKVVMRLKVERVQNLKSA